MNGYIIDVLIRDAQKHARRKRMRDSRRAFHRFVASLPPLGDSTALIREDRGRKHS